MTSRLQKIVYSTVGIILVSTLATAASRFRPIRHQEYQRLQMRDQTCSIVQSDIERLAKEYESVLAENDQLYLEFDSQEEKKSSSSETAPIDPELAEKQRLSYETKINRLELDVARHENARSYLELQVERQKKIASDFRANDPEYKVKQERLEKLESWYKDALRSLDATEHENKNLRKRLDESRIKK